MIAIFNSHSLTCSHQKTELITHSQKIQTQYDKNIHCQV